MKKEFEHHSLLFIITWPILLVFACWIRFKKHLHAGETITTYSSLLDGIAAVKKMRQGATKWAALDVIYNWKASGLLEWFYLHVRPCQALRNRYRIVVSELRSAIEESIETHGEARILSLAAGACQSVFEAASGFDKERIQIVAVDSDPSAIEAGRLMAERFGIKDVVWKEENALRFTVGDFQPTVVEVSGLIDYLSDKAIGRLFKRIRRISCGGAVMITAHIHDHRERFLIESFLDWNMLYRTVDDLRDLLSVAEFEQCKLITEPFGIFTVACGEVVTQSQPESIPVLTLEREKRDSTIRAIAG